MTNAEVDQVIVRTERRALLHFLLTSQVNGFAIVALGTLASLAFVLGESFTALLILIFLASVIGSSFFIKLQRFKRNRKVYFWNLVKKHGLFDQKPTDGTRLLVDKIINIQTATPGSELLLMRQAVKLVAAYQQQSRQLQAVEARLAKLGSTRETLTEKIKQLQALGENHSTGLRNLEQTRAGFEILQKVAAEIQSSCDRLEAILNTVRKTARARQLHRELDQLSALDAPSSQTIEPAFEAESHEDIERQIGREIETYLRLERETEEHLR